MASTPGTELGGLVVGDGSIVVPWQARVLRTWSLARGGGTCVEACGLLVEPGKPTVAGLGLKTIGEGEGTVGQVKEVRRAER